MNVFACDPSPIKSAQWLADQHVVKMTLESAQIASSALHLRGSKNYSLYRPTHLKHPCVLEAARSDKYMAWLIDHGIALAAEYLARFGKQHASLTRLESCRRLVWLSDRHVKTPYGRTPTPAVFPLAMPDEHKGEDPHESYRKYLTAKYAAWGLTKRPARWRRVVDDNPFVDESRLLLSLAA